MKKEETIMPEVNTAVVGAKAKPELSNLITEELINERIEPDPKQPPKRKTVTNWKALYDTKLYPTAIKCEGYFPMQPFNSGCHTVLQLKPETFANHLDADHGGGFWISFRENVMNDVIGARTIKLANWDGWLKFEELGLELRDMRCDVCNEEIPASARGIIRHLKPHAGKSTRVRPGGDFWFTIARDIPQETVEDEE